MRNYHIPFNIPQIFLAIVVCPGLGCGVGTLGAECQSTGESGLSIIAVPYILETLHG